jgi:hypothetical protein
MQLLTLLKASGGNYLLTGHTDAKGSAAYNLKLSRERAAAVVGALEARGVSSSTLKSKKELELLMQMCLLRHLMLKEWRTEKLL